MTQPVAVVPTATDAAGKAVVALAVPAGVGVAALYARLAAADPQAAAGLAASRGLRFEVFPK